MSAQAEKAPPLTLPLPSWATEWEESWVEFNGRIVRAARYDSEDITVSEQREWRDGEIVAIDPVEVLMFGNIEYSADDEGTAVEHAINHMREVLGTLERIKTGMSAQGGVR